jgi:hypothetical protein
MHTTAIGATCHDEIGKISSSRLHTTQKQMPQLRMRSVVGGHDGARRGLAIPIHTALRARIKTILGLRLLTEALRIGPDQPRHHGLLDDSLLNCRGIEHGEIEQGVGVSDNTGKPCNDHKQPLPRRYKAHFDYPQEKNNQTIILLKASQIKFQRISVIFNEAALKP